MFIDSRFKSKGWYTDVGTINGSPCRLWTRRFGDHRAKTDGSGPVPLVLVHGMASGVALFCNNVNELAKDRPVYAIDLPGEIIASFYIRILLFKYIFKLLEK